MQSSQDVWLLLLLFHLQFHFQILLFNDQSKNSLSIQTWWWFWRLFVAWWDIFVDNGGVVVWWMNDIGWLKFYVIMIKVLIKISFEAYVFETSRNSLSNSMLCCFQFSLILSKIQPPLLFTKPWLFILEKRGQSTVETSPPTNKCFTRGSAITIAVSIVLSMKKFWRKSWLENSARRLGQVE